MTEELLRRIKETEARDNVLNAETESMQADEYILEAIVDDEGDRLKDLVLKLKTQGKGKWSTGTVVPECPGINNLSSTSL